MPAGRRITLDDPPHGGGAERAVESIGINAVFLQRRMSGVERAFGARPGAARGALRLRITLFLNKLGVEALHGERWLTT